MPLTVTAATLHQPPPATAQNPSPALWRKRIAFTTPLTYARRLSHLLELRGWTALSFPTISVEPTPQTIASLRSYLQNPGDSLPTETLESFSALAFTSRNGISAFAGALDEIHDPPLSESGELFTISALGKDAELLSERGFISKICRNPCRIRVDVPVTASPEGLVESLGTGFGRRILCPVPIVIDLEEPPVIPDFIRDLKMRGWVPVRVPAYETRWVGRRCMEGLVGLDGSLDSIVFTSTAEVEGLLKGLKEMGWDWARLRKRWPEMVVAAHGPVTAEGAERLGVRVDLVSSRFGSFDGVVDALASRLAPLGGSGFKML